MSKRAPKRIYLEIWPEGTSREDQVHCEPTGYGVDMRTGATSRIVAYERVARQMATERKAKRGTRKR